ncbi:hypothetical protein HanIR_Chr06g0263191 [Helianthus annuus]|nr:hypothetical protein HanIR_Chr06g0263191 [Helianthus annuus]
MSSRMGPPCAEQLPPEQECETLDTVLCKLRVTKKYKMHDKNKTFEPGVIRLLRRRCHPSAEVV